MLFISELIRGTGFPSFSPLIWFPHGQLAVQRVLVLVNKVMNETNKRNLGWVISISGIKLLICSRSLFWVAGPFKFSAVCSSLFICKERCLIWLFHTVMCVTWSFSWALTGYTLLCIYLWFAGTHQHAGAAGLNINGVCLLGSPVPGNWWLNVNHSTLGRQQNVCKAEEQKCALHVVLSQLSLCRSPRFFSGMLVQISSQVLPSLSADLFVCLHCSPGAAGHNSTQPWVKCKFVSW